VVRGGGGEEVEEEKEEKEEEEEEEEGVFESGSHQCAWGRRVRGGEFVTTVSPLGWGGERGVLLTIKK